MKAIDKHTLELIYEYFDSKTIVRLEPSGQDIVTGEYSIKGCYIDAPDFLSALSIYNEWESTGDREKILFDSEIPVLNQFALSQKRIDSFRK